MMPAIGVAFLALAWLLVNLAAHGCANTVDEVAFYLHRFATNLRKMRANRAEKVAQKWMEV